MITGERTLWYAVAGVGACLPVLPVCGVMAEAEIAMSETRVTRAHPFEEDDEDDEGTIDEKALRRVWRCDGCAGGARGEGDECYPIDESGHITRLMLDEQAVRWCVDEGWSG